MAKAKQQDVVPAAPPLEVPEDAREKWNLPDPVFADAIQASGPFPTSPPPPVRTTRRARVSVPQTHFGTVEVEIPADSPDPYSAAVAAAARLRGVAETSPGRFGFGAGPQVEFLD